MPAPKPVSIELSDLETKFAHLNPSQKEFIFANERFGCIDGGVSCVAAETIIGGIPIADRKQEVVSTLFGPARPSDPYLKGQADLYRVRTRSGSQVVVTASHRFLTPTGWRLLESLRVGDVVAGDGISSARYDWGRGKDSRGCSYSDFRRNDELPHPAASAFLSKLRQLRTTDGDSSAFSDFVSVDDTDSVLRPWSANHQALSSLLPYASDADELLLPVSDSPLIEIGTPQRVSSRILLPDSARLSLPSVDRDERMAALADVYANSYWDEIQDISFVRNGQFYDLNVPFAEHYAAQGLWHHNSGKSFACCLKALVLSALMPGNVGMIMRYRGTDLENSTLKTFLDVCPKSWIRSHNQNKGVITLRNNSVIIFRHIHDASSSSRSRVLGADLGWFFIDQLEECEEAHWDIMLTRIRRVGIKKKFGFAAANPNGHDWIWRKFFQGFQPWPKDGNGDVTCMPDGKFYQCLRARPNHLGIAVNSEENRKINGGFVDDDFFQNLKDTMPPEQLARWVYCSFDDFRGKLYKDFEAGFQADEFASVHNIDPFPIPRNWQLVTGIDVGGDSPWAVIPTYIDEQGNLIVTPGFHERTGRVSEVANWIKAHTPYNESRTIHVIDPENKVATVELSDYGIYCQIARKEIIPSVLRVGGYFYVQPKRQLPPWYETTQPQAKFLKFRSKGSPRVFVFKTATLFRKEHDVAKWDPNKVDKIYKTSTERYDSIDSFRYVCGTRPEASKLAESDFDFTEMEKKDPLSAKEWKAYDRRVSERADRMRGGMALREMDMDTEHETSRNDFDWSCKGEM